MEFAGYVQVSVCYDDANFLTGSLRGVCGVTAGTGGVRVVAAHNEVVDGVLYFDGKCGMCTKARNRLLRLNRTGRLRTEPMQKPGTAELLGVEQQRLMHSAWWLDSSGEVFAGAKAVNAAVCTALGTRLPLRIYEVPGVAGVQERIYRWVATHRYRFHGVTPLCESAPGECSAPQAL